MFFLKNHEENESGRLVLDLFLFFKKALYEVKVNGLQFRALNLAYKKKKTL